MEFFLLSYKGKEKMKRSITLLIFIFMFASVYVCSGYSTPLYFSLNLTPGLSVPIGKDADFFNLGGSVGISGEYRIPSRPLFYISGSLGYALMPVAFETSLPALSVGTGAGVHCDISKRLFFKGCTSGGYFYSFMNDKTGPKDGHPFIAAGAGIRFLVAPSISIGLEGSYMNYLGLYNGIGISLGTAYHFKSGKKEKKREEVPLRPAPPESGSQYLEITDVEFEEIFPVFFKYYDDHPVGRAVLRNKAGIRITDISVSLFV